MNYSLRGLIVGTLLLLNFICIPPFLLGLPNKKIEGDAKMMQRQTRQVRAAIQDEIAFSAR